MWAPQAKVSGSLFQKQQQSDHTNVHMRATFDKTRVMMVYAMSLFLQQ
jgi:hypothetical protein